MGINNRRRRSAKQRQKRRPQAPGGERGGRPARATGGHPGGTRPSDGAGWSPEPPLPPVGRPSTPAGVRALLADAAVARHAGADAVAARLVRRLTHAWAADPRPVAAVAGRALEEEVRRQWGRGWQPSDLRRTVSRHLGAGSARLLVAAIAADAATYRDHPRADARWLAQLDEIGASTGPGGGEAWLLARVGRDDGAIGEALDGVTALLAVLWRLPELPRLCPPPDEWDRSTRTGPPTGGLDAKVLSRVRALLAKAESTTFTEEADALTSKAHQLMARHAIDRAVLDAGRGRDDSDGPGRRRVGIDDPYAGPKSLLLSEVAGATRCHAVYSDGLGFSTLFGDHADLDAVEVLYTSLLVQATSAMVAAGAGGSPRSRSRGFRQSFLVAFAVRIGQRLRQAQAATVAEALADHGDSLLPVLASREEAVAAAVEEVFPGAVSRSFTARDAAGWAAGRVAAELAELGTRAELR
jgi:hypothetical protein